MLVAPFFAAALIHGSPLIGSITHQVVIGLTAALAVYITMKLRLLSFTVPAFMAVGGYTAAILATSGHTNLIVLMAGAFVTPVLIAIPLGFLVLRLKGVYFIFFTFILNEVVQVAIFETPGLTGGPDGISGLPQATWFGAGLGGQQALLLVTVATGFVGVLVTFAVTHLFRAEFSAIEENEALAQSLGLAIWKYRMIAFLASAGVAGLAGFALVNQLSVAHPSSFSSFAAINYVAYCVVGGAGTLLGPVVGAILLVTMSNLFSSKGVYAAALFGVLLTGVVMSAPAGLVGELRNLLERRRNRSKAPPAASMPAGTASGASHGGR